MAHASRIPGRHLGVERLGRRHAHLDVTAVGCVQHAVGLGHKVTVASIDDGDHGGAPLAGEVHRAIGVGRGAGLADRHDQRVGEISAEVEARELRRRHGLHHHGAVLEQIGQDRRQGTARHRRRPLADHDHATDGAGGQPRRDVRRQAGVTELHAQLSVDVANAASQRLGEAGRRLRDLLEEEMGRVGSVDVARRDLGVAEVVLRSPEAESGRTPTG